MTPEGKKKKSGGKRCDSENTIPSYNHRNCFDNYYIFFSVHMTCRVPLEILTSLRECKLFSRLNRHPALCDQPRLLLQDLHLRHTDPEESEMTGPGKMLLGLTPGYFQSPLILPSPFQQPSHREECKRRKSLKPTKEKLTK